MQETKEQIEMYSMFRMIIYFTLVFEILVFTPLDNGPILGWLTRMLGKFFIFKTLTVCKITELVMVGPVRPDVGAGHHGRTPGT